MKLNDYQEQAMATCMESSFNWTYMSDGLVEEVGELKGKVSKAKRKGLATVTDDNIVFKGSTEEFDAFEAALKKELGDCLWMIAGIASVLGWDLEDVARNSLAKLAERKAAGTINGEGDGVDENERRAYK